MSNVAVLSTCDEISLGTPRQSFDSMLVGDPCSPVDFGGLNGLRLEPVDTLEEISKSIVPVGCANM